MCALKKMCGMQVRSVALLLLLLGLQRGRLLLLPAAAHAVSIATRVAPAATAAPTAALLLAGAHQLGWQEVRRLRWPARHGWREAGPHWRVARMLLLGQRLPVAAMLVLLWVLHLLLRVASGAALGATREPPGPGLVAIWLAQVPAVLHAHGRMVVLVLVLVVLHRRIKDIIWQRSRWVLQLPGMPLRDGRRLGRPAVGCTWAVACTGAVWCHVPWRQVVLHGVAVLHRRHAGGPEHRSRGQARPRIRWWGGSRAAPIHAARRGIVLLLLAKGGSHRPKLHVAANAAKVECWAGARGLKQLHSLP